MICEFRPMVCWVRLELRLLNLEGLKPLFGPMVTVEWSGLWVRLGLGPRLVVTVISTKSVLVLASLKLMELLQICVVQLSTIGIARCRESRDNGVGPLEQAPV